MVIKGPIYATEATIDLATWSYWIHQHFRENRERTPLYSETDAEYTV